MSRSYIRDVMKLGHPIVILGDPVHSFERVCAPRETDEFEEDAVPSEAELTEAASGSAGSTG